MREIISALVQPLNSSGVSITRAQSSPTIPGSPSKSRSSSGDQHPVAEPGNPQPKPFFHRWLDTWKSQNGGEHGQSR